MSAQRQCVCGAYFEFEFGITTVCKYCGTKHLISFSQKAIEKIEQANSLRLIGEFNKSIAIYNELIENFPSSSEMYFGRFLARYCVMDIERLSPDKVLTTNPVSVFKDEDYIKAMELGLYQKSKYEKTAKFIEERRLVNAKFSSCICSNGYNAIVVSSNFSQVEQYADILYKNLRERFDVFYSPITTGSFSKEEGIVALNIACDSVKSLYVVVDGNHLIDEAVVSLVDRFLKTHRKGFLTLITDDINKCYKLNEKTDNVILIDDTTIDKVIDDLKMITCGSLADFREFRATGKKLKDQSNPSPIITF